jgi:hypothetical protein
MRNCTLGFDAAHRSVMTSERAAARKACWLHRKNGAPNGTGIAETLGWWQNHAMMLVASLTLI